MAEDQSNQSARRQSVRRQADRALRRQLDRYVQLFQVGQAITAEMKFDVLFDIIIEQVIQMMGTERCSIFLADEQRQHLRVYVATDLQRGDIQIPKTQGVAGWVFSNQVPVIINNAYEDPRFFAGIDRRTGFVTRSILCVPLIDRNADCIGTMQVLNKKTGDFNDEDREILSYLASFVTVALENSVLYERLKASDRAKEKVIHHLAHELKTPLAIISAVLDRIAGTLQDHDILDLDKTVARGRRNVKRLLALQEKAEDIIARKDFHSEERYTDILEDVTGFLEELSEEEQSPMREIIERLTRRLQSIFRVDPVRIEEIRLDEFLDRICTEAFELCGHRNIHIERNFAGNLTIEMDRVVLQKVISGLLKNAIESTPDGGFIEVSSLGEEARTKVEVRDHGVGITAANRKQIFSGFFHTQDTAMYSSKRPYQFNAGGTGTDLLRMKIYAQRFGFSIDCVSNRCPYLPLDTDACTGKISECSSIQSHQECLSTGGTVFILRFPVPHSG